MINAYLRLPLLSRREKPATHFLELLCLPQRVQFWSIHDKAAMNMLPYHYSTILLELFHFLRRTPRCTTWSESMVMTAEGRTILTVQQPRWQCNVFWFKKARGARASPLSSLSLYKYTGRRLTSVYLCPST